MNVLVAFEGYGDEPAGAERMARKTITTLRQRGYRVAALTKSPHPPPEAVPAELVGQTLLMSAAPIADIQRRSHAELSTYGRGEYDEFRNLGSVGTGVRKFAHEHA